MTADRQADASGENLHEHPRERVEREAADWIVRLSDPALNDAARAALRAERDRWLDLSPDHHAAYENIDRTWRLLREAALSAGTLGDSGSGTPHRRPGAIRPGWTARRLVGAVAAAVLLCLLLGVARFYTGDPLVALTADYRTGPGETREVTLADGSRVTLDSNSAIDVELGGAERRVRLLEGAAAFEVAPETSGPKRPFVAEAGTLVAQALGTRFEVRRDEPGAQVTVIEHLVRVSYEGQPADAAVVLGPGERLTVPGGGETETLEAVDLDRVTAWQRGRLVFDRQPLSEVVEILNQHRRSRLLVADPALAGREVSGVFRLGDLDGAASRIAQELGASQIELPPFLSIIY